MAFPLFSVDAFTNTKFGGNPAAVCILPSAQDATWMQDVAAEINLSETAFVYPSGDAFNLRWFAPSAEVALCGHATIATSHILWQTGILPLDTAAHFNTASGRLIATRSGDWINLDFPALIADEFEPPIGLIDSVGVNPIFVGRSRFDVLMVLSSHEEVLSAAPDFTAVKQFSDVRGVILTARSNTSDFDFVSRFFCPAVGVNEDPATGSSHCTLAPYWAEQLEKTEMIGRQLSKRGGTIRTKINGSRIQLSGQAVTVTSGQLL